MTCDYLSAVSLTQIGHLNGSPLPSLTCSYPGHSANPEDFHGLTQLKILVILFVVLPVDSFQ